MFTPFLESSNVIGKIHPAASHPHSAAPGGKLQLGGFQTGSCDRSGDGEKILGKAELPGTTVSGTPTQEIPCGSAADPPPPPVLL